MFVFKDFLKLLLILTIINATNALPTAITKAQQDSGIKQMHALRQHIKECENLSTPNASNTWQCLKQTSLTIVDDMTRRPIISLWPGVRFVQRLDSEQNRLPFKFNANDSWQREDLKSMTWSDRLAVSFSRMFSTHLLEINFKELTEAYMTSSGSKDHRLSNNIDHVGTGRHRRHRFNMMITMIFGVTALGAVLIPMGFQMLSIVSGKALLLAKMALLLASINGLKRVANSGLHYGLYHVPGEHYGPYYDRGDVHHPRNVQNLKPINPSVEPGLAL